LLISNRPKKLGETSDQKLSHFIFECPVAIRSQAEGQSAKLMHKAKAYALMCQVLPLYLI
jgi:hypothetical protein